MGNGPHECPKCKGPMEEGFIIDKSHGAFLVPQWMSGAPQRSFWTGVKFKGRRMLKVRTFRCTNCGFLESYAP